MSDTLQQYKCPACGGAIEFDSDTQNMKCPYCDSEFDVKALADHDKELENMPEGEMTWDTEAGAQWQEGESEGLRIYVCNSCGGEIVCDENTAATSCPFCDSPVVMMGQLSGVLKPDLVVPFKLDKKAAIAALNKHYSGKKLLPKIFKDKNHIEEVKGIYVPFWLFDTNVNADIRYKATRIKVWSDSAYDYTQTSFYSVTRAGEIGFDGVPVDGSSKMDNTLMESIEPFDLSEAVDFQTAYLAGYLADKYDVDKDASVSRANERIKKSTEAEFAATVTGFASVTAERSNISLSDGRARYALLPVWILNTEWNGKKFTFAMNGQTGKLVGDLPIDKGLLAKHFFTALGIGTAAAFLIQFLLSLF